MRIFPVYRLFFLSFLLGASMLPVQAQKEDILPVEIFGSVVGMPAKKSLEGVVVSVYKGNFKVDEVKTDRKGKFSVFITPNSGEYQVRFSYPLHVSMYCSVNSAVPEKFLIVEKGHGFPDLPMWPTNTKDVNIYAFRDNPFAKIRWEKKMYGEDLAYFDLFRRKVEDLNEMANIRQKEMEELANKEKAIKDKEEKDRQDREQKEKELKEKELALKLQLIKEKEEREKLEKEQKDKLAKQKKLEEEQRILEQQLVHTKEDETVSDEMKLKQEKEIKEKIKKKNQAISAQYQNDLLMMVAENEKKMKESQMLKKKAETDASAIVERMKREAQLKAELDALSGEIEELKKKNLAAKNEKILAESGLIKTAAQIDKIIKIESKTGSGDVKNYTAPPTPVVVVEKTEGMASWTTTVTITHAGKKVVLKREVYIWGNEYFYKDDVEIKSMEFIAEIMKYKNIK